MIKIKSLFVLLLCICGIFSIFLFDIYKKNIFSFFSSNNEYVSLDIENFYLNKNKILMYSIREGKRNWMYDTDIYINKQGFRDDNFDTKNADTKILCIGNSITFGGFIPTKALFSSKLSDYLGEKYSVYNLGMDGYNIIQEAENLKINGIKYNPDIVIVVASLCDISSSFYKRIYYAARANNCKLNAFLCKSKFYFEYIFIPFVNIIDKETKYSIANLYRKYGSMDISDVSDEEIGFKIFSELQKEYKFDCYFFIIPFFRNFDNYLKEDDLLHEKLTNILKKYPNLKYFDLKDYFINNSTDAKRFVGKNKFDFIHPNEYGHELIAKFIYKKLKTDGVLN